MINVILLKWLEQRYCILYFKLKIILSNVVFIGWVIEVEKNEEVNAEQRDQIVSGREMEIRLVLKDGYRGREIFLD